MAGRSLTASTCLHRAQASLLPVKNCQCFDAVGTRKEEESLTAAQPPTRRQKSVCIPHQCFETAGQVDQPRDVIRRALIEISRAVVCYQKLQQLLVQPLSRGVHYQHRGITVNQQVLQLLDIVSGAYMVCD